MSVTSTEVISEPFTPNGGATQFAFGFKAASAAEVAVLRNLDGVWSVVSSALYDVALATGDGGTVTFTTAPATGSGTLYIVSEPSFTSDTGFGAEGPFSPASLNPQFDRIAIRDILLKSRIDVLWPTDARLPADRAGKFPSWDAEGNPVLASGTGADADLRADLAASTGSGLSGFLQAGASAVVRSAQSKLRDTVSVLDFGAVGNNSANDTTDCANAVATGKDVIFPEGYTFLVDGLTCQVPGQRFIINGTVKKRAGSSTSTSVFTVADVADVQFVGHGTIDGSRASFTFPTDAVSGIAAYRAENLLVDGITIQACIDCGIKAFNCPNLVTTPSSKRYWIKVNGIEIDSYVRDPRTGVAWAGLPAVASPSGDIDGFSDWIDDGRHGVGEGNGVTFAARGSPGDVPLPIINLRVSGRYRDCLRAIWSEDNLGVPSRNIVIDSPVILGNYRGPTGPNAAETKDGIGLIGVIGGQIISPTLRNVGNFDPGVSVECTGITIGGADTDGVTVSNPEVHDDTGNANRTDYGIRINYGANVTIKGGHLSGASVKQLAFSTDLAAVFDNVRIENVGGAETDFSWGSIIPFVFRYDNLPAATTTPLLRQGVAGHDAAIMPGPGRIVATVARFNANISAGTLTIVTFGNSVQQTGLEIDQDDFGGSAQAQKSQTVSAGTQLQAGHQVKVSATADGAFAPTTNDLVVEVYVDIGMKK